MNKSEIDLLTLEQGYITDGDGAPIEDEAIIHFREDVEGTCEIKVNSPGAAAIAARIVETWNAPQPASVAQASAMGISPATAALAIEVHERRATPNVGEHGSKMDICFLALAMAGEAGEAANVVKKAWRDGNEVNHEKLAEEVAGTACYLIGIASAISLDLDAEMQKQMEAFEARYSVPSTDQNTPTTHHQQEK